jgi:hypothetical protein
MADATVQPTDDPNGHLARKNVTLLNKLRAVHGLRSLERMAKDLGLPAAVKRQPKRVKETVKETVTTTRTGRRSQRVVGYDPAIIYDYIHNPWVDICAKWRPYVTIGDDTPTINGLPTPSRGGGK